MIYDDGMMQVGGRDEGTIRNALEKNNNDAQANIM